MRKSYAAIAALSLVAVGLAAASIVRTAAATHEVVNGDLEVSVKPSDLGKVLPGDSESVTPSVTNVGDTELVIHLSADYNEKQIKSVGFSGNDFVIKPKDTMDVKVSIAFLDEAEPGKDKITI